MWFRKNKWKLIVPVLVIALLAAAFCFGGAPGGRGDEPKLSAPVTDTEPEPTEHSDATPKPVPDTTDTAVPTPVPVETPEQTPQPEEAPEPEETLSPDADAGNDGPTCTIYIRCDTILNNMELCAPGKADMVPVNGWILGNTDVSFTEGETVFDVLLRVCREKSIHMEYSKSPAYNSVYIEGIANLYEFDVGSLSGWMYKVNGWFPNYGCSLYTLHDGDIIGWVYTCDLGADVGGTNYSEN